MNSLPRPWLKALSALSINISAAWFGVVVVAPNFWPPAGVRSFLLLTGDLLAGTLFLLMTVKLEGVLEKR